ncbi:hypothetical protein A3757_13820 [Oleiphilus sp. HI0117]|nr:hypothetical protein A3732_10765 [Oleiphilus sp. HI0050]KZZ35590.1 hypothetical protein A3756_15215 [Oleiphilus sp. HI0086]KZZ36372.1 hypothetical protein A3757_13820 [Oleiphilus sp. HI0117]KZZ51761.1 hypothetical protein A3761_19785 [Oleiphilus sp. HI0123]
MLIVVGLGLVGLVLYKKEMHIWLPYYLRRKLKGKLKYEGTTHVMFCFVDHYEPQWGKPNDIEVERHRVDRWHQEIPKEFGHIKDSDGCLPKHSYFYPEEEYRKEHLDKIEDLCAQGFGELEIHLHHENDTRENLTETLERFANTLHNSHRSLVRHPETGKLAYGFIHGNWTLDNCHPEGLHCGVNDELLVLKATGCYADFTLPSAPSPTQTSTVNSIYYATDDPDKPKSHDKGVDVEVGKPASGDLMIIQGPLCLNWKKRKFGFLPGIENGDIRKSIPPTSDRVDMWVDQHIHVKGRPEWVFVKIHTHGTQEVDIDTLLGEPTVKMYEYLADKYNDGEQYAMHFVSSREMYNIVKAAEAGEQGNPNEYRDYVLPKPKVLL